MAEFTPLKAPNGDMFLRDWYKDVAEANFDAVSAAFAAQVTERQEDITGLEQKISDSTWNVPDLVKFKGAIELDSDTYTTAKLNAKNASLFDTLESPLRGMYWYYVKAKTMDGYTQDSSGNWVQSAYYMPWGILIDIPYPFDGENIEQAEQKEGNPNVIPSPVIDDGSSYTRLQRLELMTSPTAEKRRVFVRIQTDGAWGEWQKAEAELASKKYVDAKAAANKVGVVDNLTDTSKDKALSANQGKILNEKIASLAQATKAYTDEEIKKVNWNDSAVIEHKGTIDCTNVEYTGSDNPDLQQHYFRDDNILSAEACLKRLSEREFDAISEGTVADGKRYHYWVLLKLYPEEFSGSTVCEFIDDRAGIAANDGSYDPGHVRIFIINDNGIRHAFKQEYRYNYGETGIVYDWTDWERICIGENDIADSAITTEKLRNKSVTAAKIADNAITADKLNDDIFSLAAEKSKAIPHTTAEGQSVKITDQLADEEPISCRIYGASGGTGDLDGTSGKYKIPVMSRGVNLFNRAESTDSGIKNETVVKMFAGKVMENADLITMLKPAAEYTISYDIEVASTPDYSSYSVDTSHNGVWCGFLIYSNKGADSVRILNSEVAQDAPVGFTAHVVQTFTAPQELHDTSKNYVFIGYTKRYKKNDENVYDNLGCIFRNIQIAEGSYTAETMPEYEPYTETTATAVLDTALGENDYIDIIEKKRYTNGTEVSDITVEGELKTADSSKCEIECQTNVQPSKMSVEYYQDINKVITEMRNAVLSQGGNV